MTRAPRLDDFGDVLTDRDLCALLQVSPRWAEVRRRDAKFGAPDLPRRIPGCGRPRYRREDVARWLETGSSSLAFARRRTA